MSYTSHDLARERQHELLAQAEHSREWRRAAQAARWQRRAERLTRRAERATARARLALARA